MKVFSTFTGIGGFELGIGLASANRETVEIVGYSEVDKYAISVYENHFEGVKNYGDITEIDAEALPDFDCIVGGFPCQAFSVAGKRRGFDDTRGTLFFDLARILRAKRPRLFVFENVKGLLNHDNGNTFRTIISTIDELGYDCQWQVLNSKNHGVPQNRERVLIVGHLRGSARPQVFPIIGTERQDIESSINEQHGPEKFIKTRFLGQNGSLISDATTLQASELPHIMQLNPGAVQDRRVYDTAGLSPTINPAAAAGGAVIPKIGVINRGEFVEKERALTITANYHKGHDNHGQRPMILQLTPSGTSAAERLYDPDGISPTLSANGGGAGAKTGLYAIREATKKGYAEAEVGDSINLQQPNSKTRRGRVGKRIANTIDTTMFQHTIDPLSYRIRRLTPMECERLQAFPDNWTKYAKGGGELSDTQRYKMCGNAVTTTVIQAVFERIFAR